MDKNKSVHVSVAYGKNTNYSNVYYINDLRVVRNYTNSKEAKREATNCMSNNYFDGAIPFQLGSKIVIIDTDRTLETISKEALSKIKEILDDEKQREKEKNRDKTELTEDTF
jgi:hypothetical protein